MNCPYCAKEIQDGSITCKYCGRAVLSTRAPLVSGSIKGEHAIQEQKQNSSGPTCPSCGFVNPQAAQYCGRCGKPLCHICPKCGMQNRAEMIYCVTCGADIEKTIAEQKTENDRTVDVRSINEIYKDYLQESKRLWQEYNKLVIPLAILFALVVVAGIFVMASNATNSGNIGPFGPGLVGLGLVLLIIFSATISRKIINKATIIAKNKPGFDKFYKSVLGRGRYFWPQTVPSGRKLEKFMSMIGRPPEAKTAQFGKTVGKRKPSSGLTIGIIFTTLAALAVLGIAAKNGSLQNWISSIFPARSCEVVDANYYPISENDCSDSNGFNTRSGYQWCIVTLRSGGGADWNLHGQNMTMGDQAHRWIPNDCIH